MKRLYLLRHGIALPSGTPNILDDDRPLSPDGERRVRIVARAMKRMKVKLDKICTSPLPRALRSAEILAEVYNKLEKVEKFEELRPDRSATSIAAWLRSRSEDKVVIVGHNPWISLLVGELVVGPEHPTVGDLRKAGIAALKADPDGRFEIDWIARPKLFRS